MESPLEAKAGKIRWLDWPAWGCMKKRRDRTSSSPAEEDLQTLEPRGAFVVQLRRVGAGRLHLAGRVEHVQSGQALRFRSSRELIGFLRRWAAGWGGGENELRQRSPRQDGT
jgi:hypothetical protein